MLLVLMILALLAAIVYPRIAHRGPEAMIAACKIQIKALGTTLATFEVDNGYLPKGSRGLLDLMQQPRDAKNWHGPYLEKIPQDPWGHDYVYEFPGKHRPASFDLTSAGPDGVMGTPDDLGNWQ